MAGDPYAAFSSPQQNDDPYAAFSKPVESQQQDPGFVANAVRAITSGANPLQDRMVAAEKTLLPQSLGGSPGFDYGANLEAQRAANQQLREQHPIIYNLGQGTGAALSSLAVPAAALGRYAEGAGVLGRTALGSAAGAGVGAVQGVGAAPDFTDLAQTFESGIGGATGGAALGAAFPAAGAAIGGAVNPLAAALHRGPGKADIANLGKEVSAAYQHVNDLGASYTPEAYQGLVDKIAADAQASRINPGLHPGASGVISDMQKAASAGKPIDLPRLDQDRQIAWRDAAGKPDAGERQFGGMIRKNIDEFIAGAPPESMASGANPADAASAIQNARDLATRQFKAQALSEALNKADFNAAKQGVGGNIENAMRQRIDPIRNKEPWSPDELEQLEGMVKGSPYTNALRQVSRLSPFGNMLTTLLEGGGSLMHPEAAGAAALVGAGAQGLEVLGRRNAQQKLLATILAGGTRPETQKAISGNYPRAALAAALAENANLQTQRRQNSQP